MIYSCCDENRRAAVMNNPALNAIDYLELRDGHTLNGQRTLLLHCLKPVPTNLTTDNVLITGGESVTGITAIRIHAQSAPPGLRAGAPSCSGSRASLAR